MSGARRAQSSARLYGTGVSEPMAFPLATISEPACAWQQHEAVPQGQHDAPPPPAPEPDPPVAYVAEQFVKHYYGVIQNNPWQLNLFYTVPDRDPSARVRLWFGN